MTDPLGNLAPVIRMMQADLLNIRDNVLAAPADLRAIELINGLIQVQGTAMSALIALDTRLSHLEGLISGADS
jgi:hypothetical protein